jgi:DNA-directed RNA polymerase subunit H
MYILTMNNMHVLQPKHIKLSHDEAEKLLTNLNISPTQLPKIRVNDPTLPEGAILGDIIKIERKPDGKIALYYRVVSI